jgi:DNA-binding NtrC family response regulator
MKRKEHAEARETAMIEASVQIRLVAIDDDRLSLELIKEALHQEDIEIFTAADAEVGMELVRGKHPQIVLVDLRLPTMSGMELLQQILDLDAATEVILITAHYSTESAVEAIRKGACDYLNKPLSVELLRQRIGKLAKDVRERDRLLQLDGELVQACRFEGMVGRSPVMMEVFSRIRRVAPHFRTALVTGATGTGKELVARALHHLRPGASCRFAACNCSAIVETLFESELFGHVKGAFTGATHDKTGLFEYAGGGTLFLDEIGDMPLATQSKLLRALESGEFQPVGSPAMRKADVRVVAATNRDLHDMMAKRLFREDLYYRLSMIEISLPGLAERMEDLPILSRYFVEKFAKQYGKRIRGLTPRAQIVLERYDWPGNVRELENVLGHACMLVEREMIDVYDLPDHFKHRVSYEIGKSNAMLPLADVHRDYVRRVLQRVGGNKALAAKILGINRTTLYRFLKEEDGEENP